MIEVRVADSYSLMFWIESIVLFLLITIVLWHIETRVADSYGAMFRIGPIIPILMLPVVFWYKKAVVNRNRILFEPKSKRVTIEHGRWFVKDEDTVQVSAIDNIKLDNTILGRLFGWCHISIVTRSDEYPIFYVSSDQARTFQAELRE